MPDTALIAGASGGIGEALAGEATVIPGLGNRRGVQALRVAARALVRRMLRTIQSRRS